MLLASSLRKTPRLRPSPIPVVSALNSYSRSSRNSMSAEDGSSISKRRIRSPIVCLTTSSAAMGVHLHGVVAVWLPGLEMQPAADRFPATQRPAGAHAATSQGDRRDHFRGVRYVVSGPAAAGRAAASRRATGRRLDRGGPAGGGRLPGLPLR